jgi:hypothetical protein
VVGDGFSTIQRDVQVTVNPLPVLNIIADGFQIIDNTIMACVFDTVVVKPGTQNVNYLWSNGSFADSTVQIASGISFDYREMWVKVTDIYTGCISRQDFNIAFAFSNCSYGIPEFEDVNEIVLFPNPSGNIVFIKAVSAESRIASVQLFDLHGRLFASFNNNFASETMSFDVSNMNQGMYFAVILMDKKVLYRKIMVVRE